METTCSQPMVSLFHCRFCATVTDPTRLLDLTQEMPLEKYKEMLSYLNLHMDLSENNNLPKYVCFNCHSKCLESYNFFLMVERSQKILSSLYNENTNVLLKNTNSVQNLEYEIKLEIQDNNYENIITKQEINLQPNSNHSVQNVPNGNHNVRNLCEENEIKLEIQDKSDRNTYSEIEINLQPENANKTCTINNNKNVDHGNDLLKKNIEHNHKKENLDEVDDDPSIFYNGIPVFIDSDKELAGKKQQSLEIKEKSSEKLVKTLKKRNRKDKHNIETINLRWRNKFANKSWTNYPWSCIHCNNEFSSLQDVREHSKNIHGYCFGLRCADCDDDFNTFNTLVEHARLHRETLRLYCQYCNKKFKDDEECHQHALNHWHTSKICDLCGEMFADQSALAEHQKAYKRRALSKSIKVRRPKVVLVESSLSWADYQWSCIDCFKDEPDIQSLRRHMREVHNKCFSTKCSDCLLVRLDFHTFATHAHQHRPYLKHYCQLCNQYFPDPSDLPPHVQLHYSQDHTCYGCGDIFPDHDLLNHHLVTYNAPSRKFTPEFSCDTCLKTFKSISSLKQHKITHAPKICDTVCNVCGKLLNNSSLKSHLESHGSKTEVCEICKKAFNSKSSLKEHAKTHIVERPYICDLCGKKFKRKKQVTEHMKTHYDIRPYGCTVCDKKFRNRSSLKTHSVQHTGVKTIECKFCDKTFSNLSNCNKHMELKHGVPLFKSKRTPMGKFKIGEEGVPMDHKAMEWLNDVTRDQRFKKVKDTKDTQ